MFNVIKSKQPKVVRVRDYMPNKPMVKIFDGGFEGAGSVEIIDKIKGEFYQKKTLDTATMGVAVYRVNNDGYRLWNTQTRLDIKMVDNNTLHDTFMEYVDSSKNIFNNTAKIE